MSWPRPPPPGAVCCQPAARPLVCPCRCREALPDPSSPCWKQSHDFLPVNCSRLCAWVLRSQGSWWSLEHWTGLEGVPEILVLPGPLTGLKARTARCWSDGARRWRSAAGLLRPRCCGWRPPAPCRRRVPMWCDDPCVLPVPRLSPWLCGRSLQDQRCPQSRGVAG